MQWKSSDKGEKGVRKLCHIKHNVSLFVLFLLIGAVKGQRLDVEAIVARDLVGFSRFSRRLAPGSLVDALADRVQAN